MTTTTPEGPEARLQARLARYGDALERAASRPAPARRLVAVDGRIGGRGAPPWRGPVGRVAAAVVLLAVLAGTAWAAARPDDAGITTAGAVWTDDAIVRPEDEPSAFAALDGTWPLPAGGSLRFVLDRPGAAPRTFAAYRAELADAAACLWFRHALELDGVLTASDSGAIAAIPTWPGQGPDGDAALREVVDAALAGDADALRGHLIGSCGGTGAGLDLPELSARWLRPGAEPSSGQPPVQGGSGSPIQPAEVPGWEALVARLGPRARVVGGVRLDGDVVNLAFDQASVAFSLTIQRLDGAVTLPVDEDAFAAGFRTVGDLEVFTGPVGDDATLAQVVGPEGASITLSFGAPPGAVDRVTRDLVDLAVDLHAAAAPR